MHQQLIKVTSSVSMGIAGNSKLVLLIAISMALFEKPPTALSVLGILVGLAGCAWYSVYKLYGERRPTAIADEKSSLVAQKT